MYVASVWTGMHSTKKSSEKFLVNQKVRVHVPGHINYFLFSLNGFEMVGEDTNVEVSECTVKECGYSAMHVTGGATVVAARCNFINCIDCKKEKRKDNRKDNRKWMQSKSLQRY